MLQANAVSRTTLDVLKTLAEQSWIKDFNLVGGTALALYWGHRLSVDIDYFSDQKINLDELEGKINRVPGAILFSKNPISLAYTIHNIKSDFVNFPYRFFYPPQTKEHFFIAHIDDVVSLKLGALANRGAKKDFYDLYYILQHYNLDQLTELYKKKFKVADILPLLKSLLYFGDAEDELPPDLVKDKQLTWPQVKKFIVQHVKEQVK
jgi:predicted nucleotidyltransferase component of viral defense system